MSTTRVLSTSHPATSKNSTNNKKFNHKSFNGPEICSIRLQETQIDRASAARVFATCLDQFLFFKSQIPLPVARVSKLPPSTPRIEKKRADFLESHSCLLSSLPNALDTIISQNGSEPRLQLCIVLGTVTMPRASMLVQIGGISGTDGTSRSSPIELHDIQESFIERGSDSSDESLEELPAESESEDEQSEEEEEEENDEPIAQLAPPSQLSLSSFTPFSDDAESIDALPSMRQSTPRTLAFNVYTPPAARPRFSPPLGRATPFRAFSEPPSALGENSSSIMHLEKRKRELEKSLIMSIGGMDSISEDIEPSRIRVYLAAPRSFESDGWLPRATAAKQLNQIVEYEGPDDVASAKLAKMNACIVRVNGDSLGVKATVDTRAHDEEVESDWLWFEWEGDMVGIE